MDNQTIKKAVSKNEQNSVQKEVLLTSKKVTKDELQVAKKYLSSIQSLKNS